MTLLYNKIKHGNPSDLTLPQKWYLVLRSMGLLKEKEVAKLLADETTLNPKEAEFAIGQLFKVVIAALLDGKTVQLGDLGSFRLTAHCEGADTKAEVTAARVKKLTVRFTESEALKSALGKAQFVSAESLVKK
ncbi:MAG: HU family DNA-binding protein [Odoribacteraceae bacterium]|jgi:predicted histone-like DNA-binding protein|nr:HU family DNA-binding protein [Odoribacteraceae bacterium]